MTRRIVLIGSAAVAALWAPYIYAELARKPVTPASDAGRADLSVPTQLDVRPTPVLFAAPVEEGHAAEAVAEDPAPPPAAHDPDEPHDPLPAEAPADEAEHPPSAVGAPNPVVAAARDVPPRTAAEPEVAPSEEGEAKPSPSAAAAEPVEPPGRKDPAAEGTGTAQEPAEDPAAAPVPENETRAAAVARGSAFREVFERESRDPAWAVTEEPRVSELLRAAGAPAQEVRCQRTVCRIALSAGSELADDSEAYRRLRSEFGAGVAIARGAAEADPLAVFILRPGFQLE